MKHQLNIIEKILIRYQSTADRETESFFQDSPQNAQNPIILSGFIFNELVQFSLDVGHLFNRSWCIVILHREDGTSYRRVMRRSDALDLIDIQITQQEASIREMTLRSDYQFQKLMANQKKACQAGDVHWEKLYQIKLAEKENQLKLQVRNHYLSIKDLLGEKQRLIRNAFRSYDILRGKQILRIQYCCSLFGMRDMAAPLKMADYDPIIDNSIPLHFQAELEKTQEKLKDVADALQTSTQSKKEG